MDKLSSLVLYSKGKLSESTNEKFKEFYLLPSPVPGHVQAAGGRGARGQVRALQLQEHNQMQGDVGTRLLVRKQGW